MFLSAQSTHWIGPFLVSLLIKPLTPQGSRALVNIAALGFARHFPHRTRTRISPSRRFSSRRMIFDSKRMPSRWHRPHRSRTLQPFIDDIGNRSASSVENIKGTKRRIYPESRCCIPVAGALSCGNVHSVQRYHKPAGHSATYSRLGRHHGQPAAATGDFPGQPRAGGFQRPRRQTLPWNAAMGHARATAIWRRTDYEHPQYQ